MEDYTSLSAYAATVLSGLLDKDKEEHALELRDITECTSISSLLVSARKDASFFVKHPQHFAASFIDFITEPLQRAAREMIEMVRKVDKVAAAKLLIEFIKGDKKFSDILKLLIETQNKEQAIEIASCFLSEHRQAAIRDCSEYELERLNKEIGVTMPRSFMGYSPATNLLINTTIAYRVSADFVYDLAKHAKRSAQRKKGTTILHLVLPEQSNENIIDALTKIKDMLMGSE